MTDSAGPIRIIEETPAYWRVAFDYSPFNIVEPPSSTKRLAAAVGEGAKVVEVCTLLSLRLRARGVHRQHRHFELSSSHI